MRRRYSDEVRAACARFVRFAAVRGRLGLGSVTHHQRERRAPFKRSLLPPGSAPLKWTSTGTSAWRARRVDLTRLASAATTGAATRARVPRVGTAAESFPVRRAACVSMDAAALLG